MFSQLGSTESVPETLRQRAVQMAGSMGVDTSAAKVRVVADFAVAHEQTGADVVYFATVGVNENIVDASWQALSDAFAYHVIECRASATAT